MQLTLFFFISFILFHRALSHHHSQAQFSHQALINSLIKLSSLSSVKLSSLSSSSHLFHLPAHTIAIPTHTVAVPRHPSPRLSPRSPSPSTSGQCSFFFCSEFFHLGVCCFGLIFLGLVLFCGEMWCCPYVVLGKIKKTFVLE